MLVSVIMPTYNCSQFVRNSIDSVIQQTEHDWELQIVDDCSTDNTPEIIKEYSDKYSNIHFSRLSKNSGPDVARTEGIKNATGKFIAFLDSDDLWHPDKLARQIEFMEKNEIPFSCTAYSQIDEDGRSLGIALFPPEKTDYKKCIRLSCPIGNLTVMYNQEELGKFTVPKIRKRNDFALWLQILKKTKYCYGFPQILSYYRVRHSGSVSSNKLDLIKYHWQLYHDIEGHNCVKSLIEIVFWLLSKGIGIGIDKRSIS